MLWAVQYDSSFYRKAFKKKIVGTDICWLLGGRKVGGGGGGKNFLVWGSKEMFKTSLNPENHVYSSNGMAVTEMSIFTV